MNLEKIWEQLKQSWEIDPVIDDIPDILTARNKEGDTLLHLAMYDEEFDFAKMLIERGTYPIIYNEDMVTAYLLVVRIDNAELLKLLIARYPNSLSTFEQSELLATAAANGQYGQLKLMLEAGFNVNESYRGSSLAEWALQARRLDIIELIHAHGAPMDQPSDGVETTPLNQAVGEGLVDIAKYLILTGADINHQTESGTTPLTMACAWEQAEIVALLLENNVDITHKKKDGKTALDFAEETGNIEIINMLKKSLNSCV